MAQKYGFFNSVNNDRVYDASDVARFLSKFFTNGVFNNSLAVNANDNMSVSVATGNANINGYGYENTESLTLDIDEADSELGRIDSVIIRLDLTNRQITTIVLTGLTATTPSQPTITRSGNIYDLRLANISVPAGATRITADMITDTRFGSDCGNVTQAVLELDTSEIFKQYETWFTEWFSNLEDQLDDNQAGHLQNEIGTLSNLETENKTNLVNAVNEVYEYAQDLLVDEYNESTTLGYSANYINNLQKIIYENNSGDDTDIICTENPNNFDYLQFDFLHQNYHASAIVPLIDNKVEISSLGIPSGNTVLQLINQRYTINGSTLEFDICGMVNMSNRTISYQAFENVPALAIKKVIGIKK